MRRSMLLAIGLSALLWAVTASMGSTQSGTIANADASCQLTSDTHGPADSDQEWRAQHHTVAAVTESLWKSAPVQAAWTPVPAAIAFDPTHAASSPDPRVRTAPLYLRHTPLLI